jgi:hypothetical protein
MEDMPVPPRLALAAACIFAAATALLAAEAPSAKSADAPSTATESAPEAATKPGAVKSGDSASDAAKAAASTKADDNGEQRRRQPGNPTPGTTVREQDTAADRIEEAIRAFKTETERYGARPDSAGKTKPARGATQASTWHGRAYEYLRNDALDATPHEVVQRGGQGNVLRRNQFGFSVNGPVVVPKLYNGRGSTFFTFSFEGTRERVGRGYMRTLPTAQQRTGDLSDLLDQAGLPIAVYDPATTAANPNYDPSRPVSTGNLQFDRQRFPNNRIPVSRLDPIAVRASQYYPLPNADAGPFFRNNYWTFPSEINSPNGFIAKVDHNLFERHKLTVDLADSRGFQGEPRIYDTAGNPGRPDRDFVDRRVSVRDTFAVSPNAVYQARISATSESIETLGIESDSNWPAELGLSGVSGQVFPNIRFGTYYGMGSPTGSFRRNAWNTYSTDHQLTLRQGKHSWAFSARATAFQLNTFEPDAPAGSMNFSSLLTGLPGINNTGDPWASFLLGMADRGTVSDVVQPSYLRRSTYDLTARDEIDLTPNLTVTLSARFDVEAPQFEKYDRQSTFDLRTINPANGLPGAMVFAGRDGQGRAFRPVNATLEPSFGLAWSPTAKRDTVVRANYMHYYYAPSLRPGMFGTQGFNGRRDQVSLNRQLVPAVTLSDGFPAAENPLPDLRGDIANFIDVDFVERSGRIPNYNYYRVTVEHRLPQGMRLTAAARRYDGRNLLIGGEIAGLNAIPLAALDYRDLLNDELFRRTLRPYPQAVNIMTDGQYPDGRYQYDIADLSLEKRGGDGLSFDFSYQLRRRFDDYSGPGVQNPFDRSTEWSRARGLSPHVVSLNYVYELPFGNGKALFNQAGFLSKVLGDWSLSGFTSWRSGDPILLEPQFNNTGTVVNGLRVNMVPGIDPRVANPGPDLWFNPLAFEHPGDFELGNGPRTHPSMLNPSFRNHDLAVTKRVPISAEKSLEFLFQSFNFLNMGNWNNPDSTIGPNNARNFNAGRIVGSVGGRVLQVGARYNF